MLFHISSLSSFISLSSPNKQTQTTNLLGFTLSFISLCPSSFLCSQFTLKISAPHTSILIHSPLRFPRVNTQSLDLFPPHFRNSTKTHSPRLVDTRHSHATKMSLRGGRRHVPRTTLEPGPPISLAELLQYPKDDDDDWEGTGSASASASSAETAAAAAAAADAAGEQTKQKVLDKILSASHDTSYNGKRFVFPEELAIEPGDTRYDLTPEQKEYLADLKRIEKDERREKRKNSRFCMTSSSEDEDEEKAKAKPGTDVLCKQGGKKCRGVKENGKCVCDPAYMEYRRWLIDMTSGEPRRPARGGGNRRANRY